MVLQRFSSEVRERAPGCVSKMEAIERILEEMRGRAWDPMYIDRRSHAISWRCRSLAAGYWIRAEDLGNQVIVALNQGHYISVHVLLRALLETLAATALAVRRTKSAIDAEDWERLANTLNRLVGVRMEDDALRNMPEAFNVQTMLDDAQKYYSREYAIEKGAQPFEDSYGLLSEVTHPNMGSYSMYQRTQGMEVVFDRDESRLGQEKIDFVVDTLAMCVSEVRKLCEELALIEDLPEPPT